MYVATPQGYRRKIGPRSRYGSTPDANTSAYGRTPQRVGAAPQRVGTDSSNSGLDAHFGSERGRVDAERSQRETADRFMFDKEKQRSDEARKTEMAAKDTATTQANSNAASAVASAVSSGGNMLTKAAGGLKAMFDAHRGNDAVRKANDAKREADRAKGKAKADAEAGRTPTVASTASPSTPKDGFKSAIDSEDQAWAKKRMAAKKRKRSEGISKWNDFLSRQEKGEFRHISLEEHRRLKDEAYNAMHP